MRKMNTSVYVGREFDYQGSRILIVRSETQSKLGGKPKFWCEPLDENCRHADKGQQFILSAVTIYNRFKKERDDAI